MGVLGAVGKLFGKAGGKVWDAVKAPVTGAINLAVSLITGIMHLVGVAWVKTFGFVGSALDMAEGAMQSVYTVLRKIVRVTIPNIVSDLKRLASQVAQLAKGLASDLGKLALRLEHKIADAVKKVTTWAWDHIYRPLWGLLGDLWRWVHDKGEYVYHLLTHPELLAKMLLLPLIHAFLALSEDALLAIFEPVTKLYLKALPRLLHLAEKFIADVF